MKFKQLLTKSLLAAVCLLAGQSVWAETASWTVSNKTYNSEEQLSSNSSLVSVTLGDGDWTYHSGRGGVYVASQAITKTDGIPTEGGYIVIAPAKDINFSLETYSSQSNVNLVMIEASAPATTIKDFRQKAYNTNDFGKLEAGKTYYIYGQGFKTTGDLEYIFYKSFTASTYEDCTINYKYGDEIIKSEVINNYVGSTVEATMTSMWNKEATTKYYVSEGASTSFTVKDSENTFDVALRLAATDAVATVNAVDEDGTVLATFTGGSGVEGETYDGYVYYTRAVLYNGKYYAVAAANGNGKNYGKNGLVYGGTPGTVTYTLDETITYYSEVEKNLVKSRSQALQTEGTVPDRASGGHWYRLYPNASIWTPSGALTPGVYTLEVSGRNQGSSASSVKIQVRTKDGTTTDVNTLTWGAAVNSIQPLTNILIPQDGSIQLYNTDATYNTSTAFDYIILRKVYDVTDASKIVGAVDYTTGYTASQDGINTAMTISEGQKIEIQFNNHGGENVWNNWATRIYQTGLDQAFRSDDNMNGWSQDISTSTELYKDGNRFYVWGDNTDENRAEMTTQMKNAVVTMTITYTSEGMFSIDATSVCSDHTYRHVFRYNAARSGELNVDLLVDGSWHEIISNEKSYLPVSKSISTAGWSTYCSPYILDFSNSIEHLDAAYIVTGGKNGVLKTTPVAGAVPANTGLLLKGTANASVNIPVAATATVDVSTNKLVGVTASGQKIDAGAGYVLMASGNDAAFYKNKNDFTLSANSAYLLVNFDGNGEARSSFLLFGDDVTGISQVAGSEVKTNGAIYNLNGQRVSNPTKGIYIIDGVKVAIE